MFYIRFEGGKAVEALTRDELKARGIDSTTPEIQSRWDWHKKCHGHVQRIARELNEASEAAEAAQRKANPGAPSARFPRYIGIDCGDCVSPRYDVIEMPKVGDKVSRAFNGDYYPAGEIVKVSASLRRVETSDGTVFYRRGETGSWVNRGTWSMVGGHRSEWNPHF